MAEDLTLQFLREIPAMRSIVLALVLAAPVCAVAATRTYTSPMNTARQNKPVEVYLTFANRTSQDREVVIGGQSFKMNYNSVLHVHAPVGTVVRVYSETNSKLNGQELMQISASDA